MPWSVLSGDRTDNLAQKLALAPPSACGASRASRLSLLSQEQPPFGTEQLGEELECLLEPVMRTAVRSTTEQDARKALVESCL